MEENFPISNIPLIFSQYRTKILEESGKQWFHAENEPGVQPTISTSLDIQSTLPTEESQHSPLEMVKESKMVDSVARPVTANIEPSTPYYHPDPWGQEKLESIATKSVDPDVSIPVSEVIHAAAVQPRPEDLVSEAPCKLADHHEENNLHLSKQTSPPKVSEESIADKDKYTLLADEDQTRPHPNSNVNLFPFESSDPELQATRYDLTEFDNGEIEDPPIAVRHSQQAKFEKLTQGDNNASQHNPEPESSDIAQSSKSNRNTRPKNASAEIAKFRLRNCM